MSAYCCCESDIPDRALPRDDAATVEADDASVDESEETAPGRCRAAPAVVVVGAVVFTHLTSPTHYYLLFSYHGSVVHYIF